MSNELIVLVHGFFKNQDDMLFLRTQLECAGLQTQSVSLPTTFGSLEDAVSSLHLQIGRRILEGIEISFVAHSMGGLIVRRYIEKYGSNFVNSCIFIATPHGGTRLADIANAIPGYSAVFKPISSLISHSSYASFVGPKTFKIGIIAGNKRVGFLGNVFLSSESDGRVEPSEAHAVDADDFIVVPFGHQDIHHQPETASHVLQFLVNGKFGSMEL